VSSLLSHIVCIIYPIYDLGCGVPFYFTEKHSVFTVFGNPIVSRSARLRYMIGAPAGWARSAVRRPGTPIGTCIGVVSKVDGSVQNVRILEPPTGSSFPYRPSSNVRVSTLTHVRQYHRSNLSREVGSGLVALLMPTGQDTAREACGLHIFPTVFSHCGVRSRSSLHGELYSPIQPILQREVADQYSEQFGHSGAESRKVPVFNYVGDDMCPHR
jgi:hypothetical protein